MFFQEIRKLSESIRASQRAGIDQMKAILVRLGRPRHDVPSCRYGSAAVRVAEGAWSSCPLLDARRTR